MIKPARMCKIKCLIPRLHSQKLLSLLQISNICQIDGFDDKDLETIGFLKTSLPEESNRLSHLISRLGYIKDQMSDYQDKKSSFLDDMLGVEWIDVKNVDELGYEQLTEEIEGYIGPFEQDLKELLGRHKSLEKQRGDLETRIRQLRPVSASSLDARYLKSSELITTVIGTIDSDGLKIARKILEEELEHHIYISTLSENSERHAVVVAYLTQDEGTATKTLRMNGFESISLEGEGKLSHIVKDLIREKQALEKPIADVKKELRSRWMHEAQNLNAYIELANNEKDKYDNFQNLLQSGELTLLSLYVPLEELSHLKRIVSESSDGQYHLVVDKNLKDAPTLLSNPTALKPFEAFTTMFSPPRYHHVDPTLFTAPTLVLFFGFMLGDAAYGIVILLASMWMAKRYARFEKVVNFSRVLMYCSISTIFFGVITGSFMGNFLTSYVLGIEVPQEELWFVFIDPLYKSNAMILLGVAVLVGVIQTIYGNIIGLFDHISQGEYRKAATENLCWLLIIAAVAVAIFGYTLPAVPIFLIGFALLFKGMGFMAVMEIPGLLGKVVSYSRLLALNLTTPGMGLAFNLLAAMVFKIPYVGIVLGPIVFILSHIIILLMNALGSFVHSLRLHYVEYYGNFYDGGGRLFTPFKQIRKYTVKRI